MANEKKPSIYVDRGTIGSSDELDEYGVWVKSEPQDLNSDSIEAPDISELSPETFVSDETYVSDESFGSDENLDLSISDIDNLPDFDTLQSEISSGIPSENPEEPAGDLSEEPVFEDTVLNDDFDLPDIESDVAAVENNDTDIFAPGDFPAGDMENIKEEAIPEAESDSSEGFTEVSMDDFIGTLESEPEEVIKETPEAPEEKVPVAEPTTVQPDLSTQLLMKIAEELSSIRAELGSLKKEFSSIKVSAQSEETGEAAFFGEEDDEKIALTGDELNNILNTADFTEEAGADATVDLAENSSDMALDLTAEPVPPEIIAPEAGFEETSPAETISDEPVPDEFGPAEIDLGDSGAGESESGGDGKDLLEDLNLDMDINLDETDLEEPEGEAIEEAASPETDLSEDVSLTEETEGLSLPEDFNLAEDLALPEETAPEETAPIEEAVPAEEEILSEEDALPEFDINEIDELQELRENGVEPMSFAPEEADTDYLTRDPLAENGGEESGVSAGDFPAEAPLEESAAESSINLADETIDLSEAVIDEPDLSSEIQDNPIEEPSLDDITISLDLSELGSEELGSEELESEELDASENDALDIAEQEEQFELPEMSEPEMSEAAEEETEPLITEMEPESQDFGADLSLIPEGFVEAPDDSIQMPEESDDNAISQNELDILEIPDEEPAAGESEIAENAPGVPEPEEIPSALKEELRTVLSYMDQLLESLPDDKIEEFAKSEFYDTYKKLFKELGLV